MIFVVVVVITNYDFVPLHLLVIIRRKKYLKRSAEFSVGW